MLLQRRAPRRASMPPPALTAGRMFLVCVFLGGTHCPNLLLQGTCLAAPADVIMTYVQTARQRGVGPAGLLPVIKGLVRDHGLRGLYRGWPVFFARMAPAFALNLTIYEQTRRLLGLPYMD